MNLFTKSLLAGSALAAVLACTPQPSFAQPVNPPAGGGGACSVFGSTAGTCAEGNDSRITGALQTSGLAAGVNTFLTTPNSANLRAALTDESGTGAALFAGGAIGAATATTPTTSDNNTNVATTAFVKAQLYAPLASPTFTGSVIAPTATLSDSSTLVATTAFVKGQAYAPLASPTFTGTPNSTTPTFNDNSTRIATTAFVNGQGYALSGTGGVYTTNQSPTATEFNTLCKTLTMNGAGLSLTIPHSTTLNPNGGCFFVKSVGNNVTLIPDAGDKINNGTTGANATLLAGTDSLITTDGAGNIYAGLGSAGAGGGFPIVIGSTSIASGSTNTTISGLTLVAPALGTPASGVGTNLTGIPIATGISGLGTNVATFLATPSASNLNGMLTGDSVALLGTAQTISAQKTFSAAGAASTPGMILSGAPFSGGSGTTTVPLLYLNSGASAPSTWSTNGTALGVNLPSGSSASFLDFHINGAASVFAVGSAGNIVAASTITGTSFTAGATGNINWNGRAKLTSSSGTNINLQTSVGGGADVTAGDFTLSVAAPTVAASQVGIGGTVAASSNCGTLASSAGCLVINVAGTTRYIPYY